MRRSGHKVRPGAPRIHLSSIGAKNQGNKEGIIMRPEIIKALSAIAVLAALPRETFNSKAISRGELAGTPFFTFAPRGYGYN
jgi:hypothetical protein